jgi:RNA polymerase sigma factor (sigma-70 family)
VEQLNLCDNALVARVLAGEREAFGPLLQRHQTSVARLCRRLLGAAPEAQDVAQEAALQAFLGLARLQEPERFGAWLHAIAANLARMALRRRRTLSLDALALQEGGPLGGRLLWQAGPPAPEEVQAAREAHDTIVRALRELSPANREAVIGYYLEGYSYPDLAELLGVPVSTVKGRLFKGRRQLRHSLEPLAYDLLKPDHRMLKERSMTTNDLVPMMIDSIREDMQHRVVLLRQDGGDWCLPIWVGQFEANAIKDALEKKQSARPMTHDLTLRLLEPVGAQVRRVVVNTIVDNTFYAEITLAAGEGEQRIDARPSDALALAVRTNVPIFATRALLEAVGAQAGAGWQPTEVEWQGRQALSVPVPMGRDGDATVLLPPEARGRVGEMLAALARRIRVIEDLPHEERPAQAAQD